MPNEIKRFATLWIESTVVAVDAMRTTTTGDGAGTVRDRLRAALSAAMRARDSVVVAAIRSTLGAIDNAEAVDAAQVPKPGAGHAMLAGTVQGLRAVEVERRTLSAAELDEIVRAEVADRHATARDYERLGHQAPAERLRGEAAVLSAYLDGGGVPAS